MPMSFILQGRRGWDKKQQRENRGLLSKEVTMHLGNKSLILLICVVNFLPLKAYCGNKQAREALTQRHFPQKQWYCVNFWVLAQFSSGTS